jgi:hypothetical protein
MEMKTSYRVVPNILMGYEPTNSLDTPLWTKKRKKK